MQAYLYMYICMLLYICYMLNVLGYVHWGIKPIDYILFLRRSTVAWCCSNVRSSFGNRAFSIWFLIFCLLICYVCGSVHIFRQSTCSCWELTLCIRAATAAAAKDFLMPTYREQRQRLRLKIKHLWKKIINVLRNYYYGVYWVIFIFFFVEKIADWFSLIQ